MGRLINKNIRQNTSGKKQKLSKGQRLGWSHQSDCEPVSLSSLSSHGVTLLTYSTGPFAAKKLVP